MDGRFGGFLSAMGGREGLPLWGAGIIFGLVDYLRTGETRFRDAALTAAEAALAANIAAEGFKLVSGRARPYLERGTHHYEPFGGGKSFFSGHAAGAFAMAASVCEYYDGVAPVVAYVLAGLVSLSRLIEDKHCSPAPGWRQESRGGRLAPVAGNGRREDALVAIPA